MFGFHSRIVHVFKDEAYDDNNNVIRSIYHVPVLGDFNFEWRVSGGSLGSLQKIFQKAFRILFWHYKL